MAGKIAVNGKWYPDSAKILRLEKMSLTTVPT